VRAAVAAVRSGQAQIGDPAVVVVIDQSDQRPGRQLDYHRPAPPQVQHPAGVRRVRVERVSDVPGLRDNHHRRPVVDRA